MQFNFKATDPNKKVTNIKPGKSNIPMPKPPSPPKAFTPAKPPQGGFAPPQYL
jgi:hypothetical protein